MLLTVNDVSLLLCFQEWNKTAESSDWAVEFNNTNKKNLPKWQESSWLFSLFQRYWNVFVLYLLLLKLLQNVDMYMLG